MADTLFIYTRMSVDAGKSLHWHPEGEDRYIRATALFD